MNTRPLKLSIFTKGLFTMTSFAINEKLHSARIRYKWTEEYVSEMVGVDIRTYRRWERESCIPHPSTLKKLCHAFGASAEELGFNIE
jgi:transcriptional regulator with XRE-family HTH domain